MPGISWLKEKIHYLVMWPINFFRDWPVRTARLFQSLHHVFLGILFLPAELVDAVRHHEGRSWLRFKTGKVINWSHQFATHFFDLLGGPELAQFFLHFFTSTTRLRPDEIAMMSDILDPGAIRYAEVRVAQGGILSLIFKMNGNLAFATWHTINIPQAGPHTRQNQSIIAHELTHVYQYERIGSRYLGEAVYMLLKTKRNCYDYGGRSGLNYACSAGGHYSDYNREQQAMIVQDYYTLQQIGADTSAYKPFITELRAGKV